MVATASEDSMDRYLASTEFIDWKNPMVKAKAAEITEGLSRMEDRAKACFEYVRDEIRHSLDYRLNPVTCRASDVLEHATGYCYAKSHLLAALLRANGIPAGMCYQRLTVEEGQPPFCLHGLNAVYLPATGWYRIDARGNKPGIEAEFTPPTERLAFSPLFEGEADLPGIWAAPLPVVIEVLTSSTSFEEVRDNLPDVEPPFEAPAHSAG